jgi:hypothetical protein
MFRHREMLASELSGQDRSLEEVNRTGEVSLDRMNREIWHDPGTQ